MPTLIAKERFYYAGRNVEKGEQFEAEAQDVAILTNSVSPRAYSPNKSQALHTAAIEPAPASQPSPPPFQAPPAAPKRRQYLRRDLRAQED